MRNQSRKFSGKWCGWALALGSVMACEKNAKNSVNADVREPAIRIGVQPNESVKDLSELEQELSSRMGMKVEFYKPTDYSQLVNEFKSERIDFAFLTGLIFIEAEKDAGAKALLKKVYGKKEFYYSAILVKKESPFRTVKDLKGKKFGFVDPKSTSGYLYPRLMLRKSGLDAGEGMTHGGNILESEFFGNHANNVQALVDKKIDAAAVWADEPSMGTGAWSEAPFTDDAKIKFRVLEYSDPIPNDVFAVREKYYQGNAMQVFKLMEALIGMSEQPDSLLKKYFDVVRLTTATSRHYDSVRQLEQLLKEEKK